MKKDCGGTSMRSDAYIVVTCEKCSYSENIELCACVRHSWDERDVDTKLKNGGWKISDGSDLCETCGEEEGEV